MLKMRKSVAGHLTKTIFEIMNYRFLNTNFALKLQGKCSKDDVATFIAHVNVTIKRLTINKQNLVLAALLEGKSMPSNIAANTNHATLLKNRSTIWVLDNFFVLCQFLASARFQLIV